MAMLTERGYGNAIDPPEFAPFDASVLPRTPTPALMQEPDSMTGVSESVATDAKMDFAGNAQEESILSLDVKDHLEAENERV
jgi:hypothetical protein